MKRNHTKGFTLIELLVVIVIIAILVALLFPAIKTVILKAEVNQARADIKVIETAVRSYINEYGKVPTTLQGQPDSSCVFGGVSGNDNSAIIRVLLAQETATPPLNPRGIVFLQKPSRKGAVDGNYNVFDPWGTQYYFAFDCNYDNTFSGLSLIGTNYNGQAGPVVISSLGPDRIGGTSDDVVNYQ